jgi:DNA-binding phage protein
LVAERPEKFTKMVTPAEKKLLEELLEKALGVNRRKAASSKGIKKAPASRKGIQRKTRHDGNPYF